MSTLIRNCQRNGGKSSVVLDGQDRVWDCLGRACPCGVKKEKLTPIQRKILDVMKTRGPAAFIGEGARKHGFGVFDAKHGGVVIRVYQLPQWFLNNRKLIEVVKRDCPGVWYTITDKGRAC